MIKILFFNQPDGLDGDTVMKIISLMPSERRRRALKMKELPQKENAVCFALLLYGLSGLYGLYRNISFKYGENGKPYIEPGPHFNFSHCKSAAVCAFSGSEVGVDIQKNTDVSEGVIRRVCTEKEREMLTHGGDFARLWTQKESILKYLGTGLSGMSALPDLSHCTSDGKVYALDGKKLITYTVEDTALSVCGHFKSVEIQAIPAKALADFIKTVD